MAGPKSRRAGKATKASKTKLSKSKKSPQAKKATRSTAAKRKSPTKVKVVSSKKSSAERREVKAAANRTAAKVNKPTKKAAEKTSQPAKRAVSPKPETKRPKRSKRPPEAASIADLRPHVKIPKTGPTEAELRREVLGMPRPTMDLTHPDHVGDLMYLTCFRGRKFGRSRFSRLVLERIAASEATDRFVANVPVELIALFFAREVRPVHDDRAPVNECFELPDGGLLEFVGDHMEAAEHVARLLLIHDETRLDHVVELLTEHDRSWLHTLALEARDARLVELGFPDLDDVDRLFAPWHAQLLIRKLQAWAEASVEKRVHLPRAKVTAEAVLAFAHDLPEPARQLALDRLHFLAICQAIHDAKRMIRRLTPDILNQSAAIALRIIAQGIREAGGDMTLIAGPQLSTAYRLGLATLG